LNVKQLEAMLKAEDTTYPVDKLKHIAKVVSTVPEGVQFVRKAERILQGRVKNGF
jgi:2-oxoglutarate dehydrogenase E1 component